MLSDTEIAARCGPGEDPLISPFIGGQVRSHEVAYDWVPVISYGLSGHGYDARLGNAFRVFTPAYNTTSLLVDPKDFDSDLLRTVTVPDHEALLIPPNCYALGHSRERFVLPDDLVGVCLGKSTYARCGLIINVTPLEAGWRGYVTIEMANATTLPVKVYAGEGIMQVQFHLSTPCTMSYAQRDGKYQDQDEEVTYARL